MPRRHQDDVADCQNRFWPETSARREFELIRLLAEEGTERMRVLWLRKCSRTSSLHQHVPGQPSQRREAAHPQAQQDAGRQPRPAPAQAQAVPKPKTAAQIASHERSQKRLNQKHLARKMWAGVRVASRLLAWLIRARARHPGCSSADGGEHRSLALDGFVERSASLGLRAALSVPPGSAGCPGFPAPLRRRPILIGRLLVQQWPATRDDAGIARLAEARRQRPSRRTLPAPPTSSAAAALGWQPPLALTLAAPPPVENRVL